MLDISLIVMAAGSSTRMGLGVKKQFFYIDDEPLWLYVTKKLNSFYKFKQTIITCDNECYYSRFAPEYVYVRGGDTRAISLANALPNATSEWVLVMDAARAGIDARIVHELALLASSGEYDCISPALGMPDTILYDGKPADRAKLLRIQSPQLSRTNLLQKALLPHYLQGDLRDDFRGGLRGYVSRETNARHDDICERSIGERNDGDSGECGISEYGASERAGDARDGSDSAQENGNSARDGVRGGGECENGDGSVCAIDFTDDSSAVASVGGRLGYIRGDNALDKITHASDLGLLSQLSTPSTRTLVGTGFDVHEFVSSDAGSAMLGSRALILGGVQIDPHMGLKAHSDGDVLAHALIDAVLGAAGLGDIGEHFSDKDERWRGADSMKLLSRSIQLVRSYGLVVTNADITVICERPKLSAYKEQIAAKLRAMLGTPHVNIKASTAEKLGAIGRGEGIACMAGVGLGYFRWDKLISPTNEILPTNEISAQMTQMARSTNEILPTSEISAQIMQVAQSTNEILPTSEISAQMAQPMQPMQPAQPKTKNQSTNEIYTHTKV